MPSTSTTWLVRGTAVLGLLGAVSAVAALLALDGDAALGVLQARNLAWGVTAVAVAVVPALRTREAFVAVWALRTLFEVGDLAIVSTGLVADVPVLGIVVFLALDVVALGVCLRWVRG